MKNMEEETGPGGSDKGPEPSFSNKWVYLEKKVLEHTKMQ
jgi:hypothetical protein